MSDNELITSFMKAEYDTLQAEERLGDVNPDGSEDLRIWGVLNEYNGYWIENKVEA